jgi:hypothetical protein
MKPSSSSSIPLPNLPSAIPPPPVFGQSQTAQKGRPKSPTPSFLGAGTVPSKDNIGDKELIGK